MSIWGVLELCSLCLRCCAVLPVTLFQHVSTAAGWFTSGAVLGGYGSAAQGSKIGPAAAAAAKTWALGVPLGVAIRIVGRGYVPAMSFIGISLAVTGVLMIGWRTALAAVTPEVSCSGGLVAVVWWWWRVAAGRPISAVSQASCVMQAKHPEHFACRLGL